MMLRAPTPRPRRHNTMAEVALAELREAIVSGELAPGTALRLDELANALGMSISPVREALRQLESLGLVVYVPHRGATVAKLAPDDLYDVYDARLTLEIHAVRRAAERFSEDDTRAAHAYLDAYRKAWSLEDTRTARQAHTDYHFSLYRSAGSDWLVKLIRAPWETCERYRMISVPSRGTLEERQREHEIILDACVERDPDKAELWLYRHLTLTANLVARTMGVDDLFPAR